MTLAILALAACSPDTNARATSSARLATGVADVLLDAPLSGIEFGTAIADAGDVNGDGVPDVIIGAPAADASEGAAYLYLGAVGGLGAAPATQLEEHYDVLYQEVFGAAVAGAGDVDGDGFDDVIVGSPGYASHQGHAFVYHGSAAGLSAVYATTMTMAGNESFGVTVDGAGDVNGDGFDDVIVGDAGDVRGNYLAGGAYVYYGSAAGLSSSPDVTILGGAVDDQLGTSVAGLGDVNDDGFDDVAVGAPNTAPASSGAVYVHYGSAAGISAAPDLTLLGTGADESLGVQVAAAGDVNADGFADLLVRGESGPAGLDDGLARVHLGGAGGLDPIAAATVPFEDVGGRVAGIGDVTGDGFDDIAVSEPYRFDVAGVQLPGRVCVYAGSAAGLDVAACWAELAGAGAEDQFGAAIAGIGDVDGDGALALAVGAPFLVKKPYIHDGRVYLYEGEVLPLPVETADTADTDVGDTDLPDTDLPDTDLPDTDLPDTDVPDTDLPDTDAPDTDVPETDGADGKAAGCACASGGSGAPPWPLALAAAALLRRRQTSRTTRSRPTATNRRAGSTTA